MLLKKSFITTVAVTSVFAFLFFVPVTLHARQYDLLIKNGHVIDPKNNIDGVKDIAVTNGKIAKVDNDIPAAQSKKTIDATGLYVVPGLIDIHTHVFVGSTPDKFANRIYSVSPDDFTFRSGVTTVVDAGTSGWRNLSFAAIQFGRSIEKDAARRYHYTFLRADH